MRLIYHWTLLVFILALPNLAATQVTFLQEDFYNQAGVAKNTLETAAV